jgi:hypothetical protein
LSQKGDLVQAVLVLLSAGGGLFWSAIKNQKKTRKIQDTARSVLSSAAQGYIESQGFAWPAFESVPTREGYDAVYFSFTLQKEIVTGSGKNKRREWITVFTLLHNPDFYIFDHSGLALIEPGSAEFEIENVKTTLWSRLSEVDRFNIQENIIKNNVIEDFPPSNIFFGLFGTRFRIIEAEVLSGSPIYAHGHFSSAEGLQMQVKVPGLGLFYRRVYEGSSGRLKNLNTLLDENKDGKVSGKEARNGYSLLAKMSLAKAKLESKEENDFNIFGHLRSSEAHHLLVADAHEVHLVGRLTQRLWLQFVGGAALLAVGIFLLPELGLDKLMSADYRSRSQVRETASASKSESLNLDLAKLHQDCVAGRIESCESLLYHKHQYQLSVNHVNYYKSKLCQLGRKYECDNK